MKKILVLIALALFFIACDYAKESTQFRPDVEITYINPVYWYTTPLDTTHYAEIEQIRFVARNSVDAYLKELVWAYYDVNDRCIFGPTEPLAIYGKINGIVDPEEVDTFILYNVSLPLDAVRSYLVAESLQSAKALLHFIVTDQYDMDKIDTATAWYGIYLLP